MPKHLTTRNNSYYFRRMYPADVQRIAGQRELKRKLRASKLREAELEAALINQEFERTVQLARGQEGADHGVAIVLATRFLQSKGLISSTGQLTFPALDPRKPEHDTIEKQLAVIGEWEAKYEATYDQLALAVQVENTAAVNPQTAAFDQLIGKASLRSDYSLKDAAEFYVRENRLKHGRTPDAQKKSEAEQRRRLDLFAGWLGGGNVELGYRKPFKSIDRATAQRFKAYLIEEKHWRVATRNKCLTYLNSAFNAAGDEFDIAGWSNPFRRLASDAQIDSQKRLSFTPLEYRDWWQSLLSYRNQNPQAALIGLMLLETGSRIIELTHLQIGDLRLEHAVPHLLVRNNPRRKLKGVIEHPVFPMRTKKQLEAYVSQLADKDEQSPLFPRYATANGNSTLSATLKKRFFATWGEDSGRNLTSYSARHAFKDRGRAAGVDLAVLDYLMGHKTKQSSVVAQGYGTGYSLSVLKEAAEKINTQEDWGYVDQLAY
ncbi:MAG: hypothetical protein CME02_10065 [Geminicoccus sp.]|nr:hypothetical protein [Geminicoccus sp.]